MQINILGTKAKYKTVTAEYWRKELKLNHKPEKPIPWVWAGRNIDDLYVGARIKVTGDNLKIQGANLKEPIANGFIITITQPTTVKLFVEGLHGKTAIELTFTEKNYGQAPEQVIGYLMPHMVIPDSQVNSPFDRYWRAIDHAVETGANYVSLYPIKSWNNFNIGNPFKPDLSGLSDEFIKIKKAVQHYAASNGVVVDWYLFSMIDIKHPNLFVGSPLNSNNNDTDWIPNESVITPPNSQGEISTLSTPKHHLHYVFQEAWPQLAYRNMDDYIYDMCFETSNVELEGKEWLGYVAFLESESKRVDIEIIDSGLDDIGTNFHYLWIPDKFEPLGDTWKTDGAWQELLGNANKIVQHQCSVHDPRNLHFAKEVADHYNIKVGVSDDGTKDSNASGEGRFPDGYRHNAMMLASLWVEANQILQNRLRVFELKVIDYEDMKIHGEETIALIRG